MKEFAKEFYKSQAWKKCREAYAKSRGYLCEMCLAEGSYTPGEIVHHKIHVDPDTITDPSVLLNHENLLQLHQRRQKKRYVIDDCGRVTPR